MTRRIIIMLCIFIFGTMFVLLFSGLYPIIFEERITRQDIDNKYVNSEFNGWYEFRLNDDLRFKLPEEWIIAPYAEEGIHVIKNGERIIAYMTTFDADFSRFSSNKDFLSNAIGEQFTAYERNNTSSPLAVASSAFYEAKIVAADETFISTYEVSLSNGSGEVVIIYHNPMEWTSQQELFLISQAIAFSFYYP